MSLWLCIRFPDLPLEALSQNTHQPVIVLEKRRVVSCNDVAAMDGIAAGQSVDTARALLADTGAQLLERDRPRERTALEKLQCWAYSITPTLECHGDNCLQLEIGSCLRLHGDPSQLVMRIQSALQQRGFRGVFGIASNRIAAYLLSYHNDDLALAIEIDLAKRLAPLSLTLIPNTAASHIPQLKKQLSQAGLENFGALLALPRHELGRRCGEAFLQWLNALTAPHDDVHRDFVPPAVFHDALWFGFEIRQSDELIPAMSQLLKNFCDFLWHTQLLTSHIEWQLLRPKNQRFRLEVRSSQPHDNAERWLELSALRLEQQTLSDDIEGLGLHADQWVSRNAQSHDLFGDNLVKEPLHQLIDRLRGRLGLESVHHIALRDAHLPELAQHLSHEPLSAANLQNPYQQRPFWLLKEPQPLHLQAGQPCWHGPLTFLQGPERIEDNWWQLPASRDYYIASASNGERLWLFKDRRGGRWYLHGLMS